MGDLNELVEIAGYRARFDATETGFAFPWDYSAKDPTPYCVYDVVEPLVRQSDHLAALTSLMAERDGAADTSMRIALKYADAAERVSSLSTRAIAAETKLKAATEARTSLLTWTKFELGPELASKQPWALVIANSEAALSLDSNKGDGV